MVRLERSVALGRQIRQDDPEELAIPNLALAREAIQEGDLTEGLALAEYELATIKACHDSIVGFVDEALTHLAQFGEEEVNTVLRKRYYPKVAALLRDVPSAREYLEVSVEGHRAHGGNLSVREERDRFVVTLDPCGSGGHLRRTKDVATAKRAYPWTWGKAGVAYYCANCCVMCEILPTELRGYPLRIHVIGDRPEDPCVHLFYKEPEMIPDEYFTRIGKTKTIR